jgi:hypothetical protein
MINDRGTKKWTSIMMPEQIDMLQKLFAEQNHKEKPILDDQQLAENAMMLHEAIENNLTVEITYFADHDFHNVGGEIRFIDTQNRYLQLDDLRIELDDIIEVNL